MNNTGLYSRTARQSAGEPLCPQINGIVYFYDVPGGVWIFVDVRLAAHQPARTTGRRSAPMASIYMNLGIAQWASADPFQAAMTLESL